MKNQYLKTGLIVLVAFVTFAFTSTITKDVKIKESTIKWKGYKVTGEHSGTIDLQSGSLSFDEANNLTGGSFTIDMTSITTTDMEGDYAKKLDGHLKSADFFGTEKNPTATLVFTNVKKDHGHYHVTGDLTIKGITHPIHFEMHTGEDNARTTLKVNRTKYGIKYGSASFFDDLKDRAISDEFDLVVSLKF